MSYILDALRKSDQQRARGAAPTLLTAQATAVAPKQVSSLSYGLLAAVLVGAGIFIGWLRPWQEEPAPRVAESVVVARAPEPSPRPAAPLPAAPETAQKVEPPLQQPAQVARATPAAAHAAVKPQAPGRAQAEARSAPPSRTADPIPVSVRPAGTGAPDSAPLPPVISMAELPISIQQELPPMSISVHAYSGKPKDRLVGINNRLLHEGDSPAPGLKLEQITPDGMIFSYKGYNFRRGVQ